MWAKDNNEKAEFFAAYRERTFQPNGKRMLVTLRRSEEMPIQRIPLVTPKELL
jgi:hypothetical protein